jgi:hypothetical protein
MRSGLFVLSFAAALAFGGVPGASAQGKVSYEQAWAKCKADIGANYPGEGGASAARYTRGAACMKQYGYRLKKSSLKQ